MTHILGTVVSMLYTLGGPLTYWVSGPNNSCMVLFLVLTDTKQPLLPVLHQGLASVPALGYHVPTPGYHVVSLSKIVLGIY